MFYVYPSGSTQDGREKSRGIPNKTIRPTNKGPRSGIKLAQIFSPASFLRVALIDMGSGGSRTTQRGTVQTYCNLLKPNLTNTGRPVRVPPLCSMPPIHPFTSQHFGHIVTHNSVQSEAYGASQLPYVYFERHHSYVTALSLTKQCLNF